MRQLGFNPTRADDKRFAKRVLRVALICSLLSLVVLARMFYLQIIEHRNYLVQAEKNQSNLLAIEPSRGIIYDRNGVVLADNTPVFSLVITRDQVPNIKKTLLQLQSLLSLSNRQIEVFLSDLKNHPRYAPIPLIDKLSQEQMAKFMLNQYRFPGVMVKTEFIRHYPLGEAFAPVLGYVGRINAKELALVDAANYSASNNIGKSGVERYFETLLHGNVGYQRVQVDANGRVGQKLSEIPPIAGKDITLTIDSQLQQVAYRAFNGERGALVAIQPATGQILALVSSPSFDPNLFVSGIDTKTYQALQNNPDRPLINRAVHGLFPFGSTAKPFYALEGLESGVITPDFKISDPGYFKLPGVDHIYHDWIWNVRHSGHGTVNVVKAIEQSCDTFFFTLSLKLGIDKLDFILQQFGFGQLTGIENKEEVPGLIASPQWKQKTHHQMWFPGDTLAAGIGQGYMLMTPIQLAHGIATIANRGQNFKPTLLLRIQSADGTIQTNSPTTLPTVTIKPEVWDVVFDGLHRVITVGTGSYHFGQAQFGKPAYDAAGKTGTAQVFNLNNKRYNKAMTPKNLRDNSLFMAFAPLDHPQIAVAVIVEHDETAGLIARQVIDYYLLHEHANQTSGTPSSAAQTANITTTNQAQASSQTQDQDDDGDDEDDNSDNAQGED